MSKLVTIDGFQYPLAVVRADILEDELSVPVGSGHYDSPEPLPYRWFDPEDDVTIEPDNDFEVYLNGKWQSAESIDFDFL
jgi:hypothetical protein